jgi:hypothetical protein
MTAARITGQPINLGPQYVETDEDYVMDPGDGIVAGLASVRITLPENPVVGEMHSVFAQDGDVTLLGGEHVLWRQGIAGNILLPNKSGLVVAFIANDWIAC